MDNDLILIRARKKPQHRVSIEEFNITKLIMDLICIEVESDYTIFNANDDSLFVEPLMRNTKLLAYSERYKGLKNIPREYAIYKPFTNDADATITFDIAAEYFDELGNYDAIEISEIEKSNGKLKYSGWLTKGSEKIEQSFIKSAPTIPILKMSIMAKMIMSEEEYEEYKELLKIFIGTMYHKSNKPFNKVNKEAREMEEDDNAEDSIE